MNERAVSPYFPLFVNLDGKRATMIGGGNTAYRRAKILIKFGAEVRVISPGLSAGMANLVRNGSVKWLNSKFSAELLEDTDLLIAATDDRAVNHSVCEAARDQRILCNICDSREESSFIFPVIAQNDTIVAGVIAASTESVSVKRLVKKIRDKLGATR